MVGVLDPSTKILTMHDTTYFRMVAAIKGEVVADSRPVVKDPILTAGQAAMISRNSLITAFGGATKKKELALATRKKVDNTFVEAMATTLQDNVAGADGWSVDIEGANMARPGGSSLLI